MARSKYLFVASMDVDPSKEALFNEVYDTEHCPELEQGAPASARSSRYEAELVQGDDRRRGVRTMTPGRDALVSMRCTKLSLQTC